MTTAREGADPPARLRLDAARNRERVLVAARRVFEERGTAFSVEEVAAAAGVGVGTIYRRFPSKEDLIDAVALPLHRQTLDLARRALELPPEAGLEWFIRRNLAFHAARALPSRRLWAAPDASELRREIASVLKRLVERAKEAGSLRPDARYQDVVVLLWTITDLVDATHPTAPRIWERHLDLVLDGLRSTPQSDAPGALPAPVSEAKWQRVVEAYRDAGR